MIRVVTVARLTRLAAEVLAGRKMADRALGELQMLRVQLELVKQSRDWFKAEAFKWEQRASKFIDQAHLKSGAIDAPVMTEREPAREKQQRVMAAMNVTEINKFRHDMPHTAAVEGVDDAAAVAAVASVLGPSSF